MYPRVPKKCVDGRIYIPAKHDNTPGWKKVNQVDPNAKTKKLEPIRLGWWFRVEWQLVGFVQWVWGKLKGGRK